MGHPFRISFPISGHYNKSNFYTIFSLMHLRRIKETPCHDSRSRHIEHTDNMTSYKCG